MSSPNPLPTIGILGAGAMGKAIAARLLSSSPPTIKKIILLNRSPASSTKAKTSLQYAITHTSTPLNPSIKLEIATTLKKFLLSCNQVFLAVKPQNFPELKKNFSLVLRNASSTEKKQLQKITYLSVIVGFSIKKIIELFHEENSRLEKLPAKWKIIRAIPNTPTLIGKGSGAIAFNKNFSRIEQKEIQTYFNLLGNYHVVSEAQIDAVSAISGSSPAFFFLFIEALIHAATLIGLPKNLSYQLAIDSAVGSSLLIKHELKKNPALFHPAILKDQVASPGGTTIEGLRILEKQALRSTIMEAVNATFLKTKTMHALD